MDKSAGKLRGQGTQGNSTQAQADGSRRRKDGPTVKETAKDSTKDRARAVKARAGKGTPSTAKSRGLSLKRVFTRPGLAPFDQVQ